MSKKQSLSTPYMESGKFDLEEDNIGVIVDKIKSQHVIHLKIYDGYKYFKFFKRKLYEGTVDELKKDKDNRVRLNYLDNFRINKTNLVMITKRQKKGNK